MKRGFFSNFLLCGCIGWSMECLLSGICSVVKGNDPKLPCETTLWMFPIYGLAAFIRPVYQCIKHCNVFIRGGIYSLGFYFVEYFSGCWLKKRHACSWDYSKCRKNIKGVICLDYYPIWFFLGLFYEKILKGRSH